MKHQLQQIREALENAEKMTIAEHVKSLDALSELERLAVEPYGTVTVVRKPGCADMHWFYRHPEPPYLDNAAECHTVYAAPPAQQPQEEHLTITWDEQQTRILAVTMQDEEGRILKVLAEAPARQPHEIEVQCPVCNHKFYEWPNDQQPQAEAAPPDMGVMELAESVGLIGPASRTDDFHAAIQRFHDLISMNVSIKAAVHFAQGLPKKGGAA